MKNWKLTTFVRSNPIRFQVNLLSSFKSRQQRQYWISTLNSFSLSLFSSSAQIHLFLLLFRFDDIDERWKLQNWISAIFSLCLQVLTFDCMCQTTSFARKLFAQYREESWRKLKTQFEGFQRFLSFAYTSTLVSPHSNFSLWIFQFLVRSPKSRSMFVLFTLSNELKKVDHSLKLKLNSQLLRFHSCCVVMSNNEEWTAAAKMQSHVDDNQLRGEYNIAWSKLHGEQLLNEFKSHLRTTWLKKSENLFLYFVTQQ